MTISVLIVDDQEAFRSAARLVVELDPGAALEVVGGDHGPSVLFGVRLN